MTPVDYHQLGRRIAAARELADLTQQGLAQKAGLTQATIGRIEKGRKPGVRVETLVAIAQALRVSADSLLGLPIGGER
jgi:transcriptional regulator with XRE-family HTH domain